MEKLQSLIFGSMLFNQKTKAFNALNLFHDYFIFEVHDSEVNII
jgi:hypothetical protein